MIGKAITVSFYQRIFPRGDWHYPFDETALGRHLDQMAGELATFGIGLHHRQDDAATIEIKGYGDLLNSIRIGSPQDGIANLCLGHIIGTSADRDLFQDLRRGVFRVAFAPETIEPDGASKIVCHNCGCGC